MGVHPFLTAGVTSAQLDSTVAARWVATVHHALRHCGGRVTGRIVQPSVGRNYYLLRVQLVDGTPLRLLLNVTVGVVAAADDRDPHDLPAMFREVPCPDVFTLADFAVADPAEPEQPLTDDHVADLTDAEREDIAYHRPPRVGDLIFNWFD
jgi:hypothetical protein